MTTKTNHTSTKWNTPYSAIYTRVYRFVKLFKRI